MRYFAGIVLVLALAGCAPETHDGAAAKAEQTKAIVDGLRAAIGSDVAKTVAAAVGTIPGAQVVPVARDKVEWGLGLLSGALGIFAAWQTKRATEERSKKRVYKANSTQAELDAANKLIYGDAFRQDLSK